MKLLVLMISLSMAAFNAVSQENSAHFFSVFDEAKAFASTSNGNVLMVFAGSDWCKPCMQFKKEILLSEEFDSYAKNHLAVLYLDFPARKQNKLSDDQVAHNEALADKYNKRGAFPSIVYMDKEGKVLGSIDYSHQSPEDFIKDCEALKK